MAIVHVYKAKKGLSMHYYWQLHVYLLRVYLKKERIYFDGCMGGPDLGQEGQSNASGPSSDHVQLIIKIPILWVSGDFEFQH